jgi:four helix bundle protein
MGEKPYRKLVVWQRAHSLALDLYKATASFPKEEVYGLTSQVRRASVSVAANIVEGHERRSKKELKRFLRIAQSSLAETEYYLELARDLGYLANDLYAQLDNVRGEVGYLLSKFIPEV